MNNSIFYERLKTSLAVLTKWLIRITFYFFCIILLLVFLLYLPPIQNFLTQKITRHLSQKLNTDLEIETLRLNLNGNLVVKNIYVQDQEDDTLLYARKIEVDVSMLRLLNKTLEISMIELNGIRSHLVFDPDRDYANYNFISETFSKNEQKEHNPDKKSEWKFSFTNIRSQEILLDLEVVHQMNVLAEIGDLEIISRFNDLNELIFQNDQIRLKNSRLVIRQENVNLNRENSGANEPLKPLSVSSKNIFLENVTFRLISEGNKNLDAAIGEFRITGGNFDQPAGKISADKIIVKESGINFVFFSQPDTIRQDLPDPTAFPEDWIKNFTWDMTFNETDLNRLYLGYHNRYIPDTAGYFSPHHFTVNELGLKMKNTTLNEHGLHTNIGELNFNESKGFRLNSFKADLTAGPEKFELKDLALNSPHSVFHADLTVDPRTLSGLPSEGSASPFKIMIVDSYLGKKDLDYFLRENPMGSYGLDLLRFEMDAGGSLKDIRLKNSTFMLNDRARIKIRGSLAEISDPGLFSFDLAIDEISSSLDQLAGFFPRIDSVRSYLPEEFFADGFIRGSPANINTTLNVKTSRGDLYVSADYRNGRIQKKDSLDVDLIINNYDIREFLKDDSLQSLTMAGKFSASGLKDQDLKLETDLSITFSLLPDTCINDIQVKGNYQAGRANMQIKCSDPLMNFDLSSNADFQDSFVDFDLSAIFSGINLYALGLVPHPVVFSSKLRTAGHLSEKSFSGNLQTDSLQLKGSEIFSIRKMVADFIFAEDTLSLELSSDNITTSFSSNMPVGKITGSISDFLKRNIRGQDEPELAGNGRMTLDIHVNEPLLQVSKLIPGLNSIYLDQISIDFDEANNHLEASMNVPVFDYRQIVADSLALDFLISEKEISYHAYVNRFSLNSLNFSNIMVAGKSMDSILYNQIINKDSAGNDHYLIGFNVMNTLEKELVINLDEENLILDGNSWEVLDGSGIHLDQNYRMQGKIGIGRNSERLLVRMVYDSIYFFEATNLNLNHFSGLFRSFNENVSIGGIVNLQSELVLKDTFPDINAHLDVTGLVFNQMNLGDFMAEMNNEGEEILSIQASLRNEDNLIHLIGNYNPGETDSPLQLDLNIDIPSLGGFESLVQGKINELEGKIMGGARIRGKPDDLEVDGDLNFDQVGFYSSQLNNKYFIERERIEFNKKQIRLNRFTVTDSLNNDFIINGAAGFLQDEKLGFDLHILADQFTVYDAT
ncbi:MAG: hypothetical protein KFF73_03755, partial [Cyclobacteriaceae bacterium]|nr:hypothetical protein [Cyclobacteriaceae bacterium]